MSQGWVDFHVHDKYIPTNKSLHDKYMLSAGATTNHNNKSGE